MHTFVVLLGAGLLLAKLVTEGLLLFVSYAVQQRFVFARRAGGSRRELGTGIPSEAESVGRQ